MPEVTVYKGTYKTGDHANYGSGQYPLDQTIGSLVVPDGLTIIIYKGDAVDDDADKTQKLYAGYYSDMSWYLDGARTSQDWLLKIETTSLGPDSLVYTHWNGTFKDSDGHTQNYWMQQGYPPSTNDVQERWVQYLVVPKSSKVTVYENASQGGASRTFGGPNTYADTSDFAVRSLDFEQDDWTQIAQRLDMDHATFDDSAGGHQESQAVHAQNPSEYVTVAIVTITDTVTTDMQQAWDVSSDVTIGSEAGTDIGVVEVEASIETTVGATYGQTTDDGQETDLSREIQVEIPPGGEAQVTMITTVGAATIPIERDLQNKRTGEIVTEQGTLTTQYAADTNITVTGGSLVDTDSAPGSDELGVGSDAKATSVTGDDTGSNDDGTLIHGDDLDMEGM